MYNYILFDMDGTIVNSERGVINAVIYALNKFGISVSDRASLYDFIGPPLCDSFIRHYGMSEEKSAEAVEFYREFYSKTGVHQNELLCGIEELIVKLKKAGKKVVLATAKPQEFAQTVLNDFNLTRYFDYLFGATFDKSMNSKTAVIEYALKQMGITDKSQAVMIGDRCFDIEGAKNNGIDSIGVLFGFGDEAELKNAGATHIAKNSDEIFNIIQNS